MNPEQILQEADRCVKCGLCLPLCPTYRKTGDEGESPRGRIALIQGLAQGQLPNSPRLGGHLDRCLGCRACEAGCPSGVAYGSLIDAGRTLQHGDDRPSKRRFRRAALDLIAKPGPMHLAAGLLRFYQRSGLQAVLRSTRLLNRIGLGAYDRLLPPLAKPFRAQGIDAAQARASQKVALFTGCVSRHLEAPVLDSAVAVLGRLGCALAIPPAQGCCGALHQHGAEPQAARRLAERNLEAFAACGADSIVGVDTGCSAHLVEYPALIEGDRQAAARAFSKQVQDISHYLTGLAWPEDLALRPLHARVAVHDPCSLRNVLKQEQAPYALLRKIPGLEILELPDNEFCCGSAGLYLLAQPAMSKRLLEDKVNAIRSLNPDILATSNVGCALQLAAGVRAAGLRIEVLHPVQLIARQMRR